MASASKHVTGEMIEGSGEWKRKKTQDSFEYLGICHVIRGSRGVCVALVGKIGSNHQAEDERRLISISFK